MTATNNFGSTTKEIFLHVQECGKIGKAQMGRLSNAIVKIFKLNNDGSKKLIFKLNTKSVGDFNQVGNFELKTELLDDQSFTYMK